MCSSRSRCAARVRRSTSGALSYSGERSPSMPPTYSGSAMAWNRMSSAPRAAASRAALRAPGRLWARGSWTAARTRRIALMTAARPPSGLSLEEGGDGVHVAEIQVLRHAVHDGHVAHVALEGGELLQDILRVLTREPREVLSSVCVGPVAAAAGGDTLCRDAVLVDLASARRRGRGAAGTGLGFLPRVVSGERIDGGVVELARHAPHIGDGVRITACLRAECLQLGRQIAGVLAREPRVLPLQAVACRSVAGTADRDSYPLGVGSGSGVRLVRARH